MILTIEPCPMPSTKRCFQGKFMKSGTRAVLKTHALDNLSISGTRMIFQEEIILKLRETRGNSKKSFAKGDENGDLKNRVGIEMNKLDFVVVKESAEDIIDQKTKFVLEEGGEHHNLIRIGCWDVFPGGRMPLQHCAVQEEVIRNELVDFTFTQHRRLE
jgi:hypothetical protein